MPEGAIESLNVRILVRLARLDVNDLDLVSFAPLNKGRRRHFRTVVDSNTARLAVLRHQRI